MESTESKVLNISEDFVKNAIKKSISECEVHIQFITSALVVLEPYFPLTVKSYSNILKDNNMAYLDQFVYRYMKLEDKIGDSLIEDIVYLIEYSALDKTFTHKLNVLEKEGIIESEQTWQYLRDLRTRLSHEYVLDVERQIKTLNEICGGYFHIGKDFTNMKEFAKTMGKNSLK